MAIAALQRRAKEARSWLMDACFPLWSEVGVGDGFFLEQLDLNHKIQLEARLPIHSVVYCSQGRKEETIKLKQTRRKEQSKSAE